MVALTLQNGFFKWGLGDTPQPQRFLNVTYIHSVVGYLPFQLNLSAGSGSRAMGVSHAQRNIVDILDPPFSQRSLFMFNPKLGTNNK